MTIKAEILVLRASRYNIEDEKTGEANIGCKITYCQGLESNEKQNSRGVDVVYGTMPYEAYESLKELPAFYEIEFSMKAGGRKNEGTLVPEKAKFLRPLIKGGAV